jgi:DNA adenine methylase Dam
MIDGFLNYAGSKYKLLEQILPHFDITKTNFIDLFVGGGSVFINVLDKYENIYINDYIDDIINIYRELSIGDDIIESVKNISMNLKDSQEDYLKLRDSYNSENNPYLLMALILSCNSNLMRFNKMGKFNQTWGKRQWNSNTDIKVNNFKDILRKNRDKINFNSGTFENFPIMKDSFYYLDPPYGFIKDSDSIGNKQISEAGYNAFYQKENDINLRDYCHKIDKIGSTFILSGVLEHGGNRSWILDKLISDGFNYHILDYNYNKVSKKKSDKMTIEVIIKNF